MRKSDEHFSALLAAYFDGTLSSDGKRELAMLLESNPELLDEYAMQAKLRAITSIPYFTALKAENYKTLTKRMGLPAKKTHRSLLAGWRNVAAAVLFVAATSLAAYSVFRLTTGEQSSLVVTAKVCEDNKTKLQLSDGSVVWLNAGSTLDVGRTFGKKRRDVYLRGEGYFEVARQEQKPFYVHVEEMQVKVLGTKFNIRGYAAQPEIVTTLLEGRVEVENRTTGEKLGLIPNQVAVCNKSTGAMSLHDRPNSRLSILWKEGVWRMNEVPLEELCREFEMLFDLKIIIRNPDYARMTFTGELHNDENIDQLLELLQKTIGIEYSKTGDTIIIR